jgi:hypothetical protein
MAQTILFVMSEAEIESVGDGNEKVEVVWEIGTTLNVRPGCSD